MRREERNRRVAPIINPAGWRILRVELKYGQEFNGGDAELLKIRNLLDQTGISAACLFRKPGAGMACEASHVHLVNNGSGRRPADGSVALPIVRAGIDDDALHSRRGVIAAGAGVLAAVVPGDN